MRVIKYSGSQIADIVIIQKLQIMIRKSQEEISLLRITVDCKDDHSFPTMPFFNFLYTFSEIKCAPSNRLS